jgi:hypothetical protein
MTAAAAGDCAVDEGVAIACQELEHKAHHCRRRRGWWNQQLKLTKLHETPTDMQSY